jgi:hypothetical protein
VRVHLAAEHALQFQAAHRAFELTALFLEVARGALIALRLGELEQFARVRDALLGALDLADVGTQARAFATQFLGARGV